MRRFAIAAAVLIGAATALPAGAIAAPCKDAKGKFIKCPPPPAAKPTRCKDGKGKFVKCGTPGAIPAK